MSTDTELPLNLYKANLELQLRIAGLFQESAWKWLELGKREMDDGVAESTAEAEQLLKTRDWQTLTTLPGEAFWHQLVLGFGDAEVAAKIALEAQTSFVADLQDAIQTWQKDTIRIVGEAGTGAPFSTAWNDLLKQWGTPTIATAAKKGAKGAVRDK